MGWTQIRDRQTRVPMGRQNRLRQHIKSRLIKQQLIINQSTTNRHPPTEVPHSHGVALSVASIGNYSPLRCVKQGTSVRVAIWKMYATVQCCLFGPAELVVLWMNWLIDWFEQTFVHLTAHGQKRKATSTFNFRAMEDLKFGNLSHNLLLISKKL